MNIVFDPVWPWSALYNLLTQVSSSVRIVALFACLAMLFLPWAHFSHRRGLVYALLGVIGLSLLLVIGHIWPMALADGYIASGGGALGGFLSGVGWVLLLIVLLLGPFALAGISAGVYAGTPNLTRTRFATIVALRLLAFLLALIALARPAVASSESEQATWVLYLLVDRSRSMTIQDERGNRSRWQQALKSIGDSDRAITQLREAHQIDVRFFAYADELSDLDPTKPGEADGKSTDTGGALRALFDRREGRVPIVGLIVVSDGADNGTTSPALAEAARWRGLPSTIHTFACGSPRTSQKQDDVAITSISTTPQPFVPVKGKLMVKVTIDARGFENSKQRVKLLIEGEDGKDVEVVAKDIVLPLTTGNEVTLEADAPAKPGEYKVTVMVDNPGDKFPLNDKIESFINVSKEGISVLVIDKLRFEPRQIALALEDDSRIRVTRIHSQGGKPAGNVASLLNPQVPYDVIILGDVPIETLRAIDPDADKHIWSMVGRGTGLIVIGGLANLGNGNWQGSELESLLPVDLSEKRQLEGPQRILPTKHGLEKMRYLFKITEGNDNALIQAWSELGKKAPLADANQLLPRPGATILARANDADKGEPLLVMWNYAAGAKLKGAGEARVLVFGGDTTHLWLRPQKLDPDKFVTFFSRFWRQSAVWLAKQEDAEGQVWVRPDARRIPVRTDIGFTTGMRGKGGGADVLKGKYEVEVFTPGGQSVKVPITQGATENRGLYTGTQTPGVYRIVVRGEGDDPSGGKIQGEATARVIVYDEDAEMGRPAADPESLAKLASAGGGGEALPIEKLPDFLNRLAEKPLDAGKARMSYRPDWQTRTRSPFLVLYFVVFCVVVSLEWGLRRWWGLK